jgi:GNAT superfamily N-acetyltransferase
MIRSCTDDDLLDIYTVINDAAHAYRGVIPPERWKEPYMRMEELRAEIAAGVHFLGYRLSDQLIGVIGLQHVLDAALIRHAYVRTAYRNQGIGGQLLAELRAQTQRQLLVGTWAAAHWAIRFYEKHGFRLASEPNKQQLLAKYWSLPASQVKASVVLTGPPQEPGSKAASNGLRA